MRAFSPRSPRFRPILRAALTAAALALATAIPAAAGPAKKDSGANKAEPFVYDRASEVKPFSEKASETTAALDKLLKAGKHREALTTAHAMLKKGGLTPEERSGLLTLAARLEVHLGTHKQAIRKAESALNTGRLSKAETADNLFFLSRLYLAMDPPNFEKAIEYQRQFNEVTES